MNKVTSKITLDFGARSNVCCGRRSRPDRHARAGATLKSRRAPPSSVIDWWSRVTFSLAHGRCRLTSPFAPRISTPVDRRLRIQTVGEQIYVATSGFFFSSSKSSFTGKSLWRTARVYVPSRSEE